MINKHINKIILAILVLTCINTCQLCTSNTKYEDLYSRMKKVSKEQELAKQRDSSQMLILEKVDTVQN